MKLSDWLSLLRAASRPLDTTELHAGAERVAARAQQLTGGQITFSVSTTASGVKITANSPSMLAQRALSRALDEEGQSIKEAVAGQGRARLIGGA